MRIDTPNIADTSRQSTSRAIRYTLIHKGRAITNQFQTHPIARCAIMAENAHCRRALSTHSRRGQSTSPTGKPCSLDTSWVVYPLIRHETDGAKSSGHAESRKSVFGAQYGRQQQMPEPIVSEDDLLVHTHIHTQI